MHFQGTMAQSINYASISPASTTAAQGARAVSSNFLTGGQRLSAKKGSKVPTPKPSTPVAGASTNPNAAPPPTRKTNGPQPLRLPPGKLFFGYEIKPLRRKGEEGEKLAAETKPKFQGLGQTLRAKKKMEGGSGSGTGSGVSSDVERKGKGKTDGKDITGRMLGKKPR